MKTSIIENTDQYAMVVYGEARAFAFFNKKRCKSFALAGAEGQAFFKKYRDRLVGWGTEGSVYYAMSKNQVLAGLFDEYSHIAHQDNMSPGDYASLFDFDDLVPVSMKN